MELELLKKYVDKSQNIWHNRFVRLQVNLCFVKGGKLKCMILKFFMLI